MRAQTKELLRAMLGVATGATLYGLVMHRDGWLILDHVYFSIGGMVVYWLGLRLRGRTAE